MNNSLSENSNSPENIKSIGIQREEAIVHACRAEMDVLKELMRSARDESISGMNVGHHLGNALCLVSGDEEYGVVGLDEGEYLMKAFHACNDKLISLTKDELLPILKEITRISSLFKTTPGNTKQFYGSRQLLEKIFDIAGVDKTLDESQKTITLFSKMERE